MRPDPSVYLRGLRGNTLDGGVAAAPAAAQPILRVRMAETFDRLIARHEVVPDLMRRFAPRQAALVDALSSELRRRALPPIEIAPAPADPIAALDATIAMQSKAFRRLANPPGDDADRFRLAGLIGEAIALEADFWRDYADALAALHKPAENQGDAGADAPFDDAAATAMLRAHMPDHPAILARNVRAIATVSSHEAYFFEIDGHPDWPREVAMRRDRAFAITFTSLADEFQILDHVSRAGFPAPRPLLFAPREPGSGKGALVMQRMPGSVQDVPTMGSAGEAIFRELAALLARLHRSDPSTAGIPVCTDRFSTQRDVLAQIEFLEGLCGPLEDMPLTMSAAFAWLRLRAADLADLRGIVHGDIDYRNMLIDDGRISGMLDWELAREGSPAQDVGYCRAQVEQVMSLDAFLTAYRAAGGPDIPFEDIRYFQILGYVQRAAYCIRAYNAYADGLMDDFIVSTVGFIDLEKYFALILDLIRDAKEADHGRLRAQA